MFRKLYAVTLFALTALAAEKVDFQKLATPINELRKGSDRLLAIRMGQNSFRVLMLTENDVTATAARSLLPQKEEFDVLKMSRDANWKEHKVDNDTTLDEPIGDDGQPDSSRNWRKESWETIATYSRTDWPKFFEFLVSNGMSGVQERKYKGGASFALAFSPISPDHIDAAGHRLLMPPAFQEQMRFSPHYPPRAGASGFVVLLHDPHENIAGRFQTVSGLRSLISANSSTAFRFLVEGAYTDPTRKIGFAGLDALVKRNDPASFALVSALLSRYLINTPMAYRLLYDPMMDADAIDDNELLKYPAPPIERSLSQQFATLQHIDDALRKPSPANVSQLRRKALTSLNTAVDYLVANLDNVSDEKLAEYYRTIGEALSTVASTGKQIVQNGGELEAADLQALTGDARFYQAQANVYQKALDRNKTMGPEIIKAARLAQTKVPIAFIGNFHTKGLTDQLNTAGVGYIVIEPRPRMLSSASEHRTFELMIHMNSRSQALSSLVLNMGPVALTASEVQQQVAPKIRLKGPEYNSMRTAIDRDFTAITGSAVDVSRLNAARDGNTSLSAIRISSGGNRPPPPTNFGEAFAYFDPGDRQSGSGSPLLILPDARDGRWREDARYEFLRTALFRPPQENGEGSIGINMDFYSLSGRLFFTVYEPQSKRIYCFEGSPQKAAGFVAAPAGPNGRDQDLRMQLGELLKLLGVRNG
jgi:hypothetical protein